MAKILDLEYRVNDQIADRLILLDEIIGIERHGNTRAIIKCRNGYSFEVVQLVGERIAKLWIEHHKNEVIQINDKH